jgi:CubicO group peptidase (beta-lactamase class C family)
MSVETRVGHVVAAADVGMSQRHVDCAARLVHEQVASGRAPSCQAIVMRHGQVVLAETAGVQRPDGPSLGWDHMFPIASAGKPFVAALILMLAERGDIGIFDRADVYVPEINAHGRNDDVLVWHLLTHTAGWPFHIADPARVKLIDGEFSDPSKFDDFGRELNFRLAMECGKLDPAGTTMRYNNAGYEVLAEIVRRAPWSKVGGDTLDAATRRELFEPLGMMSSGFIVSEDHKPLVVRRDADLPFGENSPFLQLDSDDGLDSDAGGAGAYTSALDMTRFARMLLGGGELDGVRVLSPASVAAMTTNQTAGIPAEFGTDMIPEAGWTLGMTVLAHHRFSYFAGGLATPGSVGHPGAGGAAYWVDMTNDIVIVWFEVITKVSPFVEPMSTRVHTFQDVITAAVES